MNLKFKITPVFIVTVIVIIVGIPYGIYGLTLKGGASLSGVLILIGVLICAIALLIDRIAVKTISHKKLNLVELIILIAITAFYLYSDRKLEINVKSNTDYFVLIENNGKLKNSTFGYKFPFDKTLNTVKRNAVINSIWKNYHLIDVNVNDWESLSIRPENFNNFKILFYSNGYKKFSQSEIDLLISQEIKTAANGA